jgi:molybdate transport system substrate-binding protein
MRTIRLAIAFTALVGAMAQSSAGQAAEIRVITTGIVHPTGLRDVTEVFSKKTGVKVTIVNQDTLTVLNDVKAADQAADILILPMEHMGNFALAGGIKPGSMTPLGRLQLGLYVKPGAPHPDISTVPKFVDALKTASSVTYNDPVSNSVPDVLMYQIFRQPEFKDVHPTKTFTNSVAGLKKGDGDQKAMSIGLIHQVHPADGQPYNDPILVGALPADLKAQVDMMVAISAKTADDADATAFIQFITGPEMVPVWKNRGTYRY